MEKAKECFNLKEAADFCGVCHVKMAKAVKSPGFPAFRMGRRWIIPRDALIRWMNEQAEAQAVL